jgi:hypothetical protein
MAKKSIEIAADEGRAYLSGAYSMPGGFSKYAGAQTLALMVHGFPGSKEGHDNLYGDFEVMLNEYGVHTLRFDFRGCGNSEGTPEDFTLARANQDLSLVMQWAQHQNFESIILIGEGLGAHLCLHAVNPMVKMLIMLWPVVDVADYARRTFDAENILKTARSQYADIKGRKISLDLIRELMAPEAARLPDLKIPVLIQYGTKDTVVPPTDVDILKDNLSARRIDITGYQDGTHGLPDTKHRKMISFHIKQFIEKFA